MVCGPGSPSRRLSMGDSRPAGSPLTGGGKHSPIVVEAMGVAPEGLHSNKTALSGTLKGFISRCLLDAAVIWSIGC